MQSPVFTNGGLSLVFADCKDAVQHVQTKGPDGSAGVMVFALPNDGEVPFRMRYVPEDQEWFESDGYWVGYNKNNPPTPEGIERRKICDHYRYTLADGRIWKCPRVRRGMIPLVPHWYRVRGGQITFEVRPEYRDLFERSAEWTIDGRIQVGDLVAACSECLSLNYRGTAEEFTAMNAFDDSSTFDVMRAALDEQFFIDLLCASQKKN